LCPSSAVLPNGGYIFRVHGLPVYLTHWFCMRDRSRAVAGLFAALPSASLIGSPLAGWLLGVHWWWLAGWRWLFIVEGVPAIVLIIAVFYLTDLPSQAQWLPADERDWLVSALQAELQAKKRTRDYTIKEAFCDRQILLLVAVYSSWLSRELWQTSTGYRPSLSAFRDSLTGRLLRSW
jgi:MFS transporter, ACS family, tartrate transporter